MKFDFDKVVDRHGPKCLKYDFAKERGRSDDMLPLWVADMDFLRQHRNPEKLDATQSHTNFTDTVARRDDIAAADAQTHFGWKVEKEWLIKTPGGVRTTRCRCEGYTKEAMQFFCSNRTFTLSVQRSDHR